MSTVTASTEFDLCGALPEGVTALEASAGTGKTYTIAALAARYVAEGTPLERLLLITFTRMATGELRDRVRERLVLCEQQLALVLGGAPDPHEDPVVTLLATGDRTTIAQRHERLARAVANFDAATIATTHGFCQEILAELGTVGDLDPDIAFVEDVSGLLEEVLDDLYVRRFHDRPERPRFTRAEALTIAREAVFHPMAELEPSDAPAGSTAQMRYRLADRVRKDLEQRKRRQAVMTYDDLLTRLRDTLGGANGPAARERLRARYEVVLVDEFQDTDPIQWQILHRAFAADGITLVLIADPKQAIYAFRGADVYAYLMASKMARTRATLLENRRSDQPLLDAYDALFENARLGHEEIVYRAARATAAHQRPRLIDAPDDAALRVRVVRRDELGIPLTREGHLLVQPAREHIARDLAADVVRLLSSSAQLESRAPDGTPISREPICPGDIAVLVRRNADAELIRDELHASRVPAVINGAGSVFAAPAARDWLWLLEALERPSSAARARTASLTPFLGWDAQRVACASEAEWDGLHRRLHRWSRVLRDNGVAALTQAIAAGEGLAARMLAIAEGERRLTDVNHLAQLLHRAATAERLGVSALRAWLAERMADAARDEAEEERARRLESDAEAVQVLTIHRSKGLEFPVVYAPFLWDPTWIRTREPVSFHDPALGNRHTIDVGLEGRGWRAHARQHRIEQRGEDLRLAYVALTRAKHQAVIWWAPSRDSRNSALARLLWGRDDAGNVAPEGSAEPPSDAAADARLQALAAKAPGRISVEPASVGLGTAWSPPLPQAPELRAATFERELDLRWRRTSYSDITAESHDPLVASEPERPMLDDEPAGAAPPPAGRAPRRGRSRPALAAGHDAGRHRVRDVRAHRARGDRLRRRRSRRRAARACRSRRDRGAERELGDRAGAVPGLKAAIETPLGGLVDDIRLRDLNRKDRLDELGFELPLAGGDDPTGRLTLQAIAGALRANLPPSDPMASYAARLDDPTLRASVRGFLTGSIDLVMRLPGPRFAIVDYKTNWLGAADEPLTVRSYAPAALAAEMQRAHYGLQALLYMVALHRYLRARMPGYAPESHLAAVLYLFVRGMAGPDTPILDGARCGVFAWSPPGALVQALSDVLDGGAA